MAKLSQAINAIKFVGIRATIRTILYSIKRDRIEKQIKPISHMMVEFTQPGRLTDIRPAQDHILIEFENSYLKIKFLKPNMFQVTWLPGQLPLPYAIAEAEWGFAAWKYESDEEFVTLHTAESMLKIGPDGRIEYFTVDGELVRAENPPSFLENGWSHSAQIYQNE
jgi:hypothetical protein